MTATIAPVDRSAKFVSGLTTAQADSLRAQGQGNTDKYASSRTYRDIVRHNVFTFINLTLFAIGIILLVMGQPRDALMSSGLALLNAIVGVIQEVVAKRRLDQIALLTRPTARVMRDGDEVTLPPDQLVVGDRLVIGPGDQVMLDGEIASGTVDIDESLITGESDPIRKKPGDKVTGGTFCVSGSAQYQAEKVGADTVAGAMTAGARVFTASLTPLQRDVNLIVRVLVSIAVMLLILEMLASFIWDYPLSDTVIGAAVILGIVPSGLFLMITVTYSMGAVRLAKKEALIQQVNAVESLSNIDIFCADKTGTLTTNQLELANTDPIRIDDRAFRTILGAYAAGVPQGNKTIEAIAQACPGRNATVSGEIPFSSDRKWSALAFSDGPWPGVVAIGAPEMLGKHLKHDPDQLQAPQDWYEQGWRVLLVAASRKHDLLDPEARRPLPDDLEPIGWVAFSDVLRPNLERTLQGFRKANIRLKIISGDNPETVAALARQAGFTADAKLVSGVDLEKMSDESFAVAAEEGDIFGRITPNQKQRLVEALRSKGHYVAMTGDGVNDVLSLKQADLGIAMQSGSQATRAVADMILLNDSFAAVPAAFSEGQRIRRGLKDILDLFLVRVFVVAMIILAVRFVGAGFPFAPSNMTLITLLTVGIPTFSLALFAHPGRAPGRILKPLWRFVLPATLTLFVVSFATYLLFYFLHDVDLDLLREAGAGRAVNPTVSDAVSRDALTYVMVLAGLVLVIFVAPPNDWWAVADESEHDWRPTLVAAAMLPLYIAILAIPWTRDLFEIRLLRTQDYIVIALAVVIWAIVLRYAWKYRVFERLFDYGNKSPL